jgi:hypothetical protein
MCIDAHRRVEGRRRGYETAPPRQIFEKLVNKNAIKPKIGDLPLAIISENLDPQPRDFGKNFKYPPPGFSTRVLQKHRKKRFRYICTNRQTN